VRGSVHGSHVRTVWLSTLDHFRIEQVWYLMVTASLLQAVESCDGPLGVAKSQPPSARFIKFLNG